METQNNYRNKDVSENKDIRISYTYQADIDDMKAHKEKYQDILTAQII